MKKIAALFLAISISLTIFCFPITAYAGYVKGYFKKNGTYVAPHFRSNPNRTVTDNYSFEENVNPHTGEIGTDHYIHSPSSPYFEGYSLSGIPTPELPSKELELDDGEPEFDDFELEFGRADGG